MLVFLMVRVFLFIIKMIVFYLFNYVLFGIVLIFMVDDWIIEYDGDVYVFYDFMGLVFIFFG